MESAEKYLQSNVFHEHLLCIVHYKIGAKLDT